MSGRRRHRAGALSLAGCLLATLAGCVSAPPDDAWLLEPLRYDNRLDGEGAPQLTDVTFPMRLEADTAGGVWGESVGSWLHLDAVGDALRRFNVEPGTAPRVIAFAAVTPTLLAVTATDIAGAHTSSAVMLFDTATMTWRMLRPEFGLLGDVAVSGTSISYVRYSSEAPTFTVMRIPVDGPADAATPASPELARPPGAVDASGVALGATPDGGLVLATPTERIVVSAAGEVVDRVAAVSASPMIAVGGEGEVLWSDGASRAEATDAVVRGGSAEARSVLTTSLACDQGGDRLALGAAARARPVPSPCDLRGLAWAGADRWLLSVGGEDGAPLVLLIPPRP